MGFGGLKMEWPDLGISNVSYILMRVGHTGVGCLLFAGIARRYALPAV